MKLSNWAKQQGIAYQTAWRWFKAGKMPVPCIQTKSGAILVQEAAASGRDRGTVVYCRVSSHAKKGDLDRQAERCVAFCGARGWTVDRVVKEIASGMNDQRRKLGLVLKQPPSRLVVEHKDRLTRFGFSYLDAVLPQLGCDLVVMNRAAEGRDDLMADLVAVVTSFCCRLYGKRRGSAKAKLAVEGLD
jgi:predicted site-specific integrase-resolvase